MNKKDWTTVLIIIGVIIVAILILTRPNNQVSEEITKCIGENSELYVQLGCSACENQKEMFGDSYQYLNIIDCWFETDKCDGIIATPTWIINNEKYIGVQSIEKLQELTGC